MRRKYDKSRSLLKFSFLSSQLFTKWNPEIRFIAHIAMLINITCNALDGANMPGKKERVSASAAKNAQNHMENNRYIQSELVLKQLFTYD